MTNEEFFDTIENPVIRSWAWALHQHILNLVPQVQPVIKFRTPFYVYHRWLCYINPVKDHIELGFPYGYLLSNAQGLLSAAPMQEKGKDLAQVRKVYIHRAEDLNAEGILEIIAEAALLNEEAAKQKIGNYARGKHERKSRKT